MKQKHLTRLLIVLAMVLSVVLIGSASATLTDGQLIRGDVNGDGAITMKDVLLLRKYLADMDVEIADHICTTTPGESQPVETQPGETTPSESVTTPVETQPGETTPSESVTVPVETQPGETTPSESVTTPVQTQPSESQSQPAETQATQSQPTQGETTQSQPTQSQATQAQTTQSQATQSQATQAQTTQSQATQSQPANSVKVQMNITELKTKYSSDTQTRNECFYVTKGEQVTLLLTYPDVYHATNAVSEGTAAGWFDLKANGTSITPVITSESNTKVFATYDLGTASSDITITGEVKKYGNSNKLEDFKAVEITVNGQSGQGVTTTTQAVAKVTDSTYPAVPDMVTLSFVDSSTCDQYGLLWHTYQSLSSPAIQYMEGSQTNEATFAAGATSISTGITTTTDDATVTNDYDPVNNWTIGNKSSTAKVTQYTFRGTLPKTLKASTTYSYRVGDAATGTWSAIYTFTTRPATVGNKFSFIFLNDTQFTESDDAGPVTFKSILNAAVSTCQSDFGALPQLVLHGGDITDTSANTYNYGNLFGSNGDFFGRYPMFATMGNHDGGEDAFFNNWNVTNTNKAGYYSFNYGSMHVTVLDNGSEGVKRLTDKQVTFLKSDLQANASSHQWNIVMLHRPVYGAATYNQNGYKEGQDYWEYGKPSLRYRITNICNDYDVDYVFQAHCHQYMRSYPITGYTKTDVMDETAIKTWDESNDATYVQMNSNPTMTMENGTNYYVNPNGTVYGTFSTAGANPDPVFAESSSNKTGYSENKWVMYAASGKKYSFSAVNINGGYLTIDHCYLDGTTVKHYENTRGYGIKKTS